MPLPPCVPNESHLYTPKEEWKATLDTLDITNTSFPTLSGNSTLTFSIRILITIRYRKPIQVLPAKGILCFQLSHAWDMGTTYEGMNNCLHNVAGLNWLRCLCTKCGYAPLQHAIKRLPKSRFPTRPCSRARETYGRTNLTDFCSNATKLSSCAVPEGQLRICLLCSVSSLVQILLIGLAQSSLPNSFP